MRGTVLLPIRLSFLRILNLCFMLLFFFVCPLISRVILLYACCVLGVAVSLLNQFD